MSEVPQQFAKLSDGRVFLIRGAENDQEALQSLEEHLEGKAGPQLSLWDEPSKVQVLPYNIGDVIEFSTHWADGDTSLPSLERLAQSLKKSSYLPGPLGSYIAARVCSTRIAEGKVWMMCERIPPILGHVDDESYRDDEVI